MFWNDYITDNLNKVCDCSEDIFSAMEINGNVELDIKNNVVRCRYESECISFEKPIIELTERIEYRIYKNKLGKVVRKRKLGQFDFRSNTITIFIKNLELITRNEKASCDDYLPIVIGHELFHGIHANLLLKSARWYDQAKDAKVKTVTETLATCFEFLLCEKLLGKGETQFLLEKLSEDTFPECPYAGAKEIIATSAFHKCSEILNASRKDWKKAYNIIESIRE